MKQLLIPVVAAGALLATAAQATTVTTATETVTFGPQHTEFNNATQSLHLFDSTLGPLTSVTISGSYAFSSSVTLTNSAASASNGSVRTESAAAIGSANGSINAIVQALLDTNGPVTIGSDTRKPTAYDVFGATAVYTLATGNTTTVASNHLSPVSVSATDTTAADLLAFQAAGGGIFDVLFTTLTGTLLSNTGGNTSAGQVTTATSTVSISYTYDTIPTPEPASIALLGAGLLSVGAIRRKRR